MSQPDALDTLLASYGPPPVTPGLADRVAEAALAREQAPRLGALRRTWRDRRGAWLRRPLIAGGVALGLAFSSAVAATLAGVELVLPPKVQTVLAEMPFFGRMAKAEPPAPAPVRRAEPRPARQPARAEVAPETPAFEDELPIRGQRARAVRNWLAARRIVAERRAAGLPTPRADRIEWMIEQRLVRQGVLPADPVERAAVREEAQRVWRERARARREMRRARFAERGMMDRSERIAPVGPRPEATEPEATAESSMETAALNRAELRRIRAERGRIFRERRFERQRRWRERREQLRPIEPEPTEGAAAPTR